VRARNPHRIEQGAAHRPPGSFLPIVPFRIFVFVLAVIEVVVVLFLLVVFVVVVFVVVVGRLELQGRRAGDLEVGAAVGAADQVPLVDVELIDFDLGIAFRTGRHTYSSTQELHLAKRVRTRVHAAAPDFEL
jgi:hypothetical protein